MVVDAELWHWTPNGMRKGGLHQRTEYITVRDAERPLEEAHARGRRAAEGERLTGAAYLRHVRDGAEP